METTKYIWLNGKLLEWEKANTHLLTHTLHYGAGAFEGIRCYATDRGPAVFRLREHIERLHYSAKTISMKVSFSVEDICRGVVELIRATGIPHGYIRPLVFYGAGVMGLSPLNAPVELMIACWPWGKYLPHDMVDIKVSRYIRIHPQSTHSDAKICGHYVNSVLAALEVRGNEYQEALLLDYEGLIAEGPGENFFMVKGTELITPPLGRILAGITRDTVMQLAKDQGYKVTEKNIRVEDVLKGDEAFFTGTAAEITPIRSINKDVIGDGEIGPVTAKLKDLFQLLVHGKLPKFDHFLTYTQTGASHAASP